VGVVGVPGPPLDYLVVQVVVLEIELLIVVVQEIRHHLLHHKEIEEVTALALQNQTPEEVEVAQEHREPMILEVVLEILEVLEFKSLSVLLLQAHNQ